MIPDRKVGSSKDVAFALMVIECASCRRAVHRSKVEHDDPVCWECFVAKVTGLTSVIVFMLDPMRTNGDPAHALQWAALDWPDRAKAGTWHVKTVNGERSKLTMDAFKETYGVN